jgi:hypothetical protein
MTPIRGLKFTLSFLLTGCAMTQTPTGATSASAATRVVVEVVPVAGLPPAQGIAQAQDIVIASLPPDRALVTRRYTALPLLALQIDPALIDTLRHNAAVAKVSPDEDRTLKDE